METETPPVDPVPAPQIEEEDEKDLPIFVEILNPHEFSYDWLRDDRAKIDPSEEEFFYLDDQEKETLNYRKDVDRLYLIKWKGLSYSETNWEKESALDCGSKINDFRRFNKALDKEGRVYMEEHFHRHKRMLELINNKFNLHWNQTLWIF